MSTRGWDEGHPQAAKNPSDMNSTSQATVLIVDDTPQNIHLLRETLRETYRVVAATSGAKALEIANRDPQPDIILLDVMMPEMDGYEVCRKITENPSTSGIPIMFVTALTESGDEEKGLALGAVDYITKPFQPALVKSRVHNQLELKRHRDCLEEEVRRRTDEALEARLGRERLESELSVARTLQTSMLPPLVSEELGLAAGLRPARHVGGDLYDYTWVDESRLLVTVGDVSDKGVASSLFMVKVLTLLRTFSPHIKDLSELMGRINRALCDGNDTYMFVTLLCCLVNTKSGEWQLCSGGHEPPVVLGEGHPYLLEMDSGPALGLLPEAKFPSHSGCFASNASFLFYTDGVTDALSEEDEFFGEDRLLKACEHLSEREPEEAVSQVLASLERFSGSSQQFDDITLLYLRGRPGHD